MSATEIIGQFKDLPASERAQVAKYVVEQDDSWIPESFKQAWPMPGPDASWTWKRPCLKHRRRICDEPSLPRVEPFWIHFTGLPKMNFAG